MKTWERPKLVVFHRGSAQEVVLSHCKSSTVTQTGTSDKTCESRDDTCGAYCFGCADS